MLEILIATARNDDGVSDRLANLPAPELARVLRAGADQGLGTTLVASLQAANLAVPGWLQDHRFDVTTQRNRLMNTLAAIAPELTARRIPWVVLKGPVTAAVYDPLGEREFADLDILVPGYGVGDAIEALGVIGVDGINKNWGTYQRYGVAEFPVFVLDTPIDLHWHFIGLDDMRKRFNLLIDEILDRRQTVRFGGVDCNRLDAEDNIIHIALHAGLSGGYRLGWLRDVHHTVRANDLDWDELVSRASRYGVGPVIGHVLDRCRSVIGTPVPSEIPGRLAPVTGLAIRRWLDEQPPLPGKRSEISLSGFPVAMARSGVANTLGRTGELLRERLTETGHRSPRWSAYDPEGPLYWNRSTGGPDGLASYLEFARRQR